LDALQIVLIASGRGRFETRATGLHEIKPGEAFVVLPGVWHRYEPDPKTGWEESWIEVRGAVVTGLIKAGIFRPEAAVNRGTFEVGMHEALAAIHERSRTGSPGFDAGRVAAAFGVLAAWQLALQAIPKRGRIAKAVAEAEHYLADHYSEEVNIEQLARKLGVAYSHFRRAFREQTGFAPWQYMVHLRLSRARRMLASSDATMDDIANQLNFSSSSHFSVAFKKAYGIAPALWRRDLYSRQAP
jgi:AraC-like DNA-binding protein